MSEQTTWYCNKDTRVAQRQSDGLNQGAGDSVALPFGYYSGYIYRAYLAFADDIGSLNAIDKAVLWLRTSDQYYVSFGSDPDLNVTRLTEWSEGEGSSSGLSTGNATVYGDAPYDGAIIVQKDVTPAINTWVSIDITSLIRAAKTAGAFHGLMLSSTGTGSSDVGEFWAREKGSSYRPYIVVDYTNNVKPNAPTLSLPATGQRYASTAVPTFKFTGSDPDSGDTQQAYKLQLHGSSSIPETGALWESGWTTSGQSGFTVTRAYNGPALAPGTYYWRAKTRDAALLEGAWSGVRSVVVNALPAIATIDLPADGVPHVAVIHNLSEKPATGSVTFSPKPQFKFIPKSADGEAITEYKVEIQTIGGAAVATETKTGSFASGVEITHNATTVLTNLTNYRVRFLARDAYEGYGPASAWTSFWVKYAQAVYQYNIAGASGITVTPGTITGSAVLLYRTATGPAGAGAGAWQTSAPPTVPAYLNVLVRLASSGTAPAQPKLTSLNVTYYGAALLPLGWSYSGVGWASDENVRKVGAKSLALQTVTSGATRFAYRVVGNITPLTDYVASVWVNVDDISAGYVGLHVRNLDGVEIASVLVNRVTDGWERFVVPFRSESESSLTLLLRGDPAFVGSAHFDGVMLAEGKVAPVWSPSLTGPAVVDAQGIVVDGEVGGTFRVMNYNGSPIEMGVSSLGITFGEDFVVFRDAASRLAFKSLGATNARVGLWLPSGYTGSSSGWFVMHEGDSVPVAGMGKDSSGNPALMLGPGGSAAQDAQLSRSGPETLRSSGHFLINKALRLTQLSPTALAANVNNYAPPGLHDTAILRLSSDTTVRTITGIEAGVTGDMLWVYNANASTAITLAHADAGSATANRILCAGNAAKSIPARSAVLLWYDGTQWRMLATP